MRRLPIFQIAVAGAAALALGAATPCQAQFGDLARKIQDKANQAQQKAQKAKQAKDIYTDWTPDQEQQVGQASAAKLINIFGLYENPDLVRYVNLVGATVAQQAPRPVPYRFGILDTDVITALSLPGGYVFITRGALVNMSSEAELAGTLAHEVAHVDQRHLEKEIRSKDSTAFLAAQATQFTTTQLSQIASTSAQHALTQQYSRDKEADADRLGVQFASRAGYQAGGLRLFLTFLSQAPVTPESQRQLSLWGSTHPPFPERIASLTAEEATLPSSGQSLQDRFRKHVNPAAFAGP
jgi:predicted Zn-dependent protease